MTQKCKTTKGAQNITKIARGEDRQDLPHFCKTISSGCGILEHMLCEWTEYLNVFRVNLSCSTAFYRIPHLTIFYFGPKNSSRCSTGRNCFSSISSLWSNYARCLKGSHAAYLLLLKKKKKKIAAEKAPFFSVDKWCRWPAGETRSVVGFVVILFKCFFLTQTIVIGSSIPPTGTLI